MWLDYSFWLHFFVENKLFWKFFQLFATFWLDVGYFGAWVYFLRVTGLPKHPSRAGEYFSFSPKIDILKGKHMFLGFL